MPNFSYGGNGFYTKAVSHGVPVKFAAIRKFSVRAMIFEIGRPFTADTLGGERRAYGGTKNDRDTIAFRHGADLTNIGFADGHVECRKYSSLPSCPPRNNWAYRTYDLGEIFVDHVDVP